MSSKDKQQKRMQDDLTNPLAKTDTGEPEKIEDPVKAHGIGLKQSEWDKLTEIAQALGWESHKGPNRHKVAVYAIRYFLKHIESGELQLQEPKHKTLPGL